ncbi:MAG: YgaP family membrane protein [Chloroflexota bacterium]
MRYAQCNRVYPGRSQPRHCQSCRPRHSWLGVYGRNVTDQLPISPLDRILRLGTGAAATVYAVNDGTWWLLALGLLIMFTGVYDRCPIWKAITGYIKSLKKTS